MQKNIINENMAAILTISNRLSLSNGFEAFMLDELLGICFNLDELYLRCIDDQDEDGQ